MQDQPLGQKAAPEVQGQLTEPHVEQLELWLHEGKFSRVAEDSLRWVQQGLADGALRTPLGLRLLFVSIQSHFMLCKQAELQLCLEQGHHGVVNLQPEAFILWQVMQLECGDAGVCKPQLQAYLQHCMSAGQAATADSLPAAAAAAAGQTGNHTHVDKQQQQQQAGQFTRSPPSAHAPQQQHRQHSKEVLAQDQKHALALCRLYAVDVLSEALQQYTEATDFLTAPGSVVQKMLTEEEVAMLQSEVAALQFATAVRQQAGSKGSGVASHGAAPHQDGLAAQYCTMLGELNDMGMDDQDNQPEQLDAANAARQGRAATHVVRRDWQATSVWQSVRALTARCATALGMQGHAARQQEGREMDPAALHEAAPSAVQGLQQVADSTEGSSTSIPTATQQPNTTASEFEQQQQQQQQHSKGSVGVATTRIFSKLGECWRRVMEHGAGQLGDVLYALIASLLLYALYKEWKAIRAAFRRPLSAIRAPVRDLLSMAFALSPNPIASGRMPAGRRA